jgi:SdrD B-like domain
VLPRHRQQDAASAVLALVLLGGLSLAVDSQTAHADTSDGTLTVVVNRDENDDHVFESGVDGPQPGIQIAVTDASGATVRGITDDDGQFVLDGTRQLAGGRYTVAAEIPPNLSELAPVPASETYAPFTTTVDVSTSSQTVRMGVAPAPVSTTAATAATVVPAPTTGSHPARFAVGDHVWRDVNRSGVQDPSEPPAAKVSVQLVGLDGEVVDSTVSSASGHYVFDDQPAGTYRVRFAGIPRGFRLTTTGSGGNPGADSDPDYAGETPPFTLGVGAPNVRASTAADGVTAGYINPTIDAGIASLRYALGDCVWLDLDGDGIEDPDEPPAAAEVSLLSEQDTVIAVTRTDAKGHYLFTNLEEGQYRVLFSDLGDHRAFTALQVGSDASVDSDPDPRTGKTQVIRLGPAAADLVPAEELGVTDADLVDATVNAGVVGAYSLGDTVWRDKNGNGVFDPGEAGLAHVRVQLLSAAHQVLSTVTTSSTGHFAFDGLAPGTYEVRFTAPHGLVFTSRHSGTNSAVDSDANRKGVTQPVVLGEEDRADTTIDAGLTTADKLEVPPTGGANGPMPVDTALSSTGGVALSIPLAGLALVASGISCLLAGRKDLLRRR